MSDTAQKPTDTSAQAGGPTIENVKGEFSRKFGTLEAQVSELAKTNAALLEQIKTLKGSATPPPAPKEKPLSDLIYDNPDEAVRIIEDRAEKRVLSKIEQRDQAQRKQTQAINELYSEFPEFADNDHALTKKALEIYGKMEDAEKADPKALKLAGYQAAVELDVKPRSKRGDDDSFSFGSAPSGGRPRRDTSKLDPKVADFARLMGVNVDDPKVAERMKARQK
jgi:hypothetical protein